MKNMFELFVYALKNPFDGGRACRWEYNAFVLVSLLIDVCAVVFALCIVAAGAKALLTPLLTVWLLFKLYVALAGLSLTVRRLHDLNLSGLFVIALIAIGVASGVADKWATILLNLLLLGASIALMAIKGEDGKNKFGNVSPNYKMPPSDQKNEAQTVQETPD